MKNLRLGIRPHLDQMRYFGLRYGSRPLGHGRGNLTLQGVMMNRDDLIKELLAKRSIGADDVLRLRQDVFKDGVVDRTEVEAVFELDTVCENKDRAWDEFYVDELTYYFVFQVEPRGYVGDENAQFLIDQIVRDGRIAGPTELGLLINIVDSANSCPQHLISFVLEAVKDSVLSPDTAAYGRGRRAGVITPVDVELVRAAIHAGGGSGTYTVTRPEADLLFDLNDATTETENADSWREVFVKGVGSYLMYPLKAPSVPSANEVVSRNEWFQERPTYSGFLRGLGSALRDFDVMESMREVDLFGTRRAREGAEREKAQAQEAMIRESIDEGEAQWLKSRLDRQGPVTENERALLDFIKRNAPRIPSSLDELFAKAGL